MNEYLSMFDIYYLQVNCKYIHTPQTIINCYFPSTWRENTYKQVPTYVSTLCFFPT